MAEVKDEDAGPEVGLIEAVWRYRWSSILVILMCGVVAGMATVLVLAGVSATARFAVTDPRSTSFLRQGVSSDSSYIAYTSQRAAFAQSAPVLERAQEILATKYRQAVDIETLREGVEASAASSGGIVEVTASARTDATAARIANSVVAAYQDLTSAAAKREQEQLVKSIRATRAGIEKNLKQAATGSALADSLAEVVVQLQLKESDAQIDLTQYGGGVRFVDEANPARLTPSKLPRNIAIGLAVGSLLALVVAFLRATNPIATVQRVTSGTGQRHRGRRPRPLVAMDDDPDEPTAVYNRSELLGAAKPGARPPGAGAPGPVANGAPRQGVATTSRENAAKTAGGESAKANGRDTVPNGSARQPSANGGAGAPSSNGITREPAPNGKAREGAPSDWRKDDRVDEDIVVIESRTNTW
ncbi:hypothetical protein [Sphaerisporangium sp. TRM90804]|uniref:hypothetical protein n=1 Tax=Sphaerisporangium sp. TRM90804 TaxID=3031113 RepID=UPI0024485D5C|nr:hypothetical protein [Sphaerisporangium sp. TRM90804]MDH2428932.1 hypothetical protein [Sphaerisporangium sp. TRM90804]